MRDVARSEGTQITDSAIELIGELSDGDMRRGLNLLESSAAYVAGQQRIQDSIAEPSPSGSGPTGDTPTQITCEVVYTVAPTAPREVVQEILAKAVNEDYIRAREKLDKALTEQGVMPDEMLDSLERELWRDASPVAVDTETRLEITKDIAEAAERLKRGGDGRLQLEALVAELVRAC